MTAPPALSSMLRPLLMRELEEWAELDKGYAEGQGSPQDLLGAALAAMAG